MHVYAACGQNGQRTTQSRIYKLTKTPRPPMRFRWTSIYNALNVDNIIIILGHSPELCLQVVFQLPHPLLFCPGLRRGRWRFCQIDTFTWKFQIMKFQMIGGLHSNIFQIDRPPPPIGFRSSKRPAPLNISWWQCPKTTPKAKRILIHHPERPAAGASRPVEKLKSIQVVFGCAILWIIILIYLLTKEHIDTILDILYYYMHMIHAGRMFMLKLLLFFVDVWRAKRLWSLNRTAEGHPPETATCITVASMLLVGSVRAPGWIYGAQWDLHQTSQVVLDLSGQEGRTPVPRTSGTPFCSVYQGTRLNWPRQSSYQELCLTIWRLVVSMGNGRSGLT